MEVARKQTKKVGWHRDEEKKDGRWVVRRNQARVGRGMGVRRKRWGGGESDEEKEASKGGKKG